VFRRGLIGYLPANLVQGLVGLLSILVFTRVLTPEAYGRYALGFSAMSLAHTLVFTWLEAALARFWPAESAGGETGAGRIMDQGSHPLASSSPGSSGGPRGRPRTVGGPPLAAPDEPGNDDGRGGETAAKASAPPYFSQSPDGGRNLLATVYRAFLRIALGFLPVCALGLWLWPADPSLKWALGAGLAAVVFRSLVKLVQERRRAAGEVMAASGLDMVQTAGGFALGAGLAALGFGAAGPLLGLGLAAAACLPFALPGELARAKGGRADPRRLATYAAYGFPVSLSLILALALATTDRFLIAALLDAKSVGAYHAAYSLANRTLDVMFLWLGGAGAPALVMALERGGQKALADSARTQAGALILLTLPAAVGLMLVARPLSEVMIGEGLRDATAGVAPLIAVGAFCSGVTTYYFHQAFLLSRRTHRLLWAMSLPAAANVALNLLLIPKMGLIGAAWAAALSYALGAVASWAFGRGAQALPIPWTTLSKCALACLLMVPAVRLVPDVGGLVELLAKAAAGGLAYACGVLLLDAAGARGQATRLFKGFQARLAA
jgi:O-antigen/teichoic acid export membrane protein